MLAKSVFPKDKYLGEKLVLVILWMDISVHICIPVDMYSNGLGNNWNLCLVWAFMFR